MKNGPPNFAETNDPLDALLREADDHVPDNGFTRRVLISLPRRQRRGWLRVGVLAGALLAGAALADWDLPSVSALLAALPRTWSMVHWQTLLMLLPGVAAFAALVWGAYALINDED
jgi:hypothetical protein